MFVCYVTIKSTTCYAVIYDSVINLTIMYKQLIIDHI